MRNGKHAEQLRESGIAAPLEDRAYARRFGAARRYTRGGGYIGKIIEPAVRREQRGDIRIARWSGLSENGMRSAMKMDASTPSPA